MLVFLLQFLIPCPSMLLYRCFSPRFVTLLPIYAYSQSHSRLFPPQSYSLIHLLPTWMLWSLWSLLRPETGKLDRYTPESCSILKMEINETACVRLRYPRLPEGPSFINVQDHFFPDQKYILILHNRAPELVVVISHFKFLAS